MQAERFQERPSVPDAEELQFYRDDLSNESTLYPGLFSEEVDTLLS